MAIPAGISKTSVEIVGTKLRAPTLRSEHVPRPRLLELLGVSSERRVTLIGAPAGYGKTTLLTQWCQSVKGDLPFAWVSLDEQDNDPVRLWRHIIEALRQVAPEEEFAADVLVALGVARKDLVEAVLPMLINDLTELPHQVVLVLDDYHCINETICHESVAFFMEHLPHTLHLVISTRSYPPLPLGRLRAKGEMNEVRTEQLTFLEEEASSLLEERLRLDISYDDLLVVLDRTEGWPAGIYLAALSLREKGDTRTFVESFRGSDRYIVDLLGEEVLATLPEEVRTFLLRTSILEKMSGPLCDAVVEVEGSGELLRALAHTNLLVVPLSEDGEWYRYHNLFADFLRYELSSTQPKVVSVLYERASAWFEREGMVSPAIRHAIAAGEYTQAGTLIARHWFSYAVTGQMVTLQQWLDALPEDLTDGTAALALVRAWICTLYGWREEGERFLALAESTSYEGKLPDGTASVESGVAIVRGLFGYGGVQAWVKAAQRAAELESVQISPRTALVHLGLGYSSYCSGDIARARREFEQGLRLTRVEQPILLIPMLSALSFVALDEGHLEEAESLAREAVALVERFKLQEIPQATFAPIAFGRVLAERGKLDEAQAELEKSLSVRRRFPDLSPWPTLIGLLALAPVRHSRGDRAGARALLAEARAILEVFPDAGMFPELLERQERMLRTSPRRDGALDGKLTERELDVVRLLKGELSTREMAGILFVSPSTVRTHVKSIYRKFGVSSREKAVEQAHAKGFI